MCYNLLKQTIIWRSLMETIFKPNVFIINAKAGHGKDTVRSIIEKHYEKHLMTSEKVSFAETAKGLCTVLIPENIINMPEHKNMEPIDLLEHLKDNRPDLELFKGYNARKTLQYVLGNMFRSFSKDIHIGWCSTKIHNSLIENNFKVVFNCTDNRYENERKFLRTLNSIKNNYDLLDYLRFKILNAKPNLNYTDLEKSFNEAFKGDISVNDIRVKKLLNGTLAAIQSMELPQPTKKWIEKEPDLSKLSFEEALEEGFINVFRPLLDPNKNYDSNNNVEQEIKTYTGMDDASILKVKEFYKSFGIDFSIKNIKKYGYLRADPTHLSERELDTLLSERVINDPFDKNGNNTLKTKIINEIEKKENKLKNIKIESKRRETINISLPANLVLDINNIENLANLDISLYRETIKNISKLGLVLDKGKLSNIFNYTNALNILSEDEKNVIPEFHMGVITRNAPYEARLIHQSLRHHKIYPEFMAFTNGKKRSEYNEQFSVDCVITHSARSEKDHVNKEFLAVKAGSLRESINKIEKDPTIKNILDFYQSTIDIYGIKQTPVSKEKIDIYQNKLNEVKKYFKERNLMDFSLKGFELDNKSKLGNYTPVFDEKDYKIKNPKELNIELSNHIIKGYHTTGTAIIEKLNIIEKNNPSDIKINVFVSDENISDKELNDIKNNIEKNAINVALGKGKNIDLYITNDNEECKKMNLMGKPSITIENRNLNKKELEKIRKGPLRMLFDLDEVVVKDEETLFRLHSLRFFNSYQQNYYEIPLNKGPLFGAFYKFGKISKSYDELLEKNRNVGAEPNREEKPLTVAALTSRGGHFPCMRFMNFMEKNELFMDEALFMGGKDKTEHILYNMKLNGLVQFIDDHPIHVKRIREAIEKEDIKNISVSQCVSGIHAKTMSQSQDIKSETDKVKQLLAKNIDKKRRLKNKKAP